MSNKFNRRREYEEKGVTIYPKFTSRVPMLLTHKEKTGHMEPMCLQPSNNSNYRYSRTATWIQAIVRSNDNRIPKCGKYDCYDRAEHGAHMQPFYGVEDELFLFNENLKQDENVAENDWPTYVIPLCQKHHNEGLTGSYDIWDNIEVSDSEIKYWPEIIIIDNQSLDDTISDKDYFRCPGCIEADSNFLKWYSTKIDDFPIEPCKACGKVIYSSETFLRNSGGITCECADFFTEVDEFGLCMECGLEFSLENEG